MGYPNPAPVVESTKRRIKGFRVKGIKHIIIKAGVNGLNLDKVLPRQRGSILLMSHTEMTRNSLENHWLSSNDVRYVCCYIYLFLKKKDPAVWCNYLEVPRFTVDIQRAIKWVLGGVYVFPFDLPCWSCFWWLKLFLSLVVVTCQQLPLVVLATSC